MRHGKAHAKLSRPTAHRLLMLRNLVSSLFQHQQIKTTLAKAKEAAPLAEKMITLAKKGTLDARREVESFVLNPLDTIPKVFNDYVPRYAHRHGGYTRIHKFGNRQGDNAPVAILELVDNPQDIRFALTARAVGREVLTHYMRDRKGEVDGDGVDVPREADELEPFLREKTVWNLKKVLRYRSEDEKAEFNAVARSYVSKLVNEPLPPPRPSSEADEEEVSEDGTRKRWRARRPVAGERLTGMDLTRVGLGLAQGVLGRRGEQWLQPVFEGERPVLMRRVESEPEPEEEEEGEGEGRTWPPKGWVREARPARS